MNREMKKTLVFVVAALLMTGAAILGRVDRSTGPEAYNDQGRKFFDDFDPTTCTDLQVIDFDPDTAQASAFNVSRKDGRWLIPSHSGYPADAKTRLVETATGVFGLTKDSIRSDNPEDQEVFGVVDPLELKPGKLKGIGKRITLKDASDKVLADFIIGNEVKDHPNQRYVRVPRQKRIYGVNVKVDLSTRFADWIETNLLKLDVARVRRIVIDHKEFDPVRGVPIPGEVINLERKDSSTPWKIEGMPEGKEPNTETLLALSNALGDLKIAGIRPKPDGLTADLKETTGKIKTDRQGLISLASKGFYPTNIGLLSNKGEVKIMTDEGVLYTLRFGEAVFASGNELSGGIEPASKKDAARKDATKGNEGTSEGRFLFVTTSFDPTLIPPPKLPANEDEKFPDDPFAYDGDEKKLVVESKAAKDRAEKLQKETDRLIEEGKKKVQELTDRFAAWYYVTPGDSYRTIVQDQAKLIRDKSAKPANPGPMPRPGGRPGGFDPSSFGLPPGH